MMRIHSIAKLAGVIGSGSTCYQLDTSAESFSSCNLLICKFGRVKNRVFPSAIGVVFPRCLRPAGPL